MWIYSVASDATMSSILVRQEGIEHHPTYYISYLLKGPKLYYTSLEKLTLVLTLMALYLQPYIMLYPIVVVTYTSLKHILTPPEATGRSIKWAKALSEYNIEYQPWQAIQGDRIK